MVVDSQVVEDIRMAIELIRDAQAAETGHPAFCEVSNGKINMLVSSVERLLSEVGK